MKTALLAGATGLIGGQLLGLLLEDNRYRKVIAISRKPLDVSHPKLQNTVLDFEQLKKHSLELKSDDIFCCLGTTMKQAKSKAAFRKVDFEFPVELARIGKELGAGNYLLVSALGASNNSSIFYNQVKGEAEDSISKTGIRSLHIFRPSLLMGPRSEKRAGEDAAKWFYKFFGFIIPAKYKSIESIKVARAMVSFAQQPESGIFIHESLELQTY